MSLTVACTCGQHYAVEDQYAGQQVPCPRCGRTLVIPQGGPAVYQAPEYQAPPGEETPGRRGGLLALVLLSVVLLVGGGVVALVVWLGGQRQEQTAATPPPNDPADRGKEGGPPRTSAEKQAPRPAEDTPPPPQPPSRLPAPSREPWKGHLSALLAVQITADGKHLLTASGGAENKDGKVVLAEDNTLRRWDTRTGREVQRLEGFPDGIGTAAFSPDGRYAAVAAAGTVRDKVWEPGSSGDLSLWDLSTRHVARILRGHQKEVLALAFSRDSRQLLSGGNDHSVRLWDVQTGKEVHRLDGHTRSVNAVAFAPDASLGLSAGTDHTARLWDLRAGRELRELGGHADFWAVAFSPDGKHAASAGGMQEAAGTGERDFEVRLWDVSSAKEVRRLVGHAEAVRALAFSKDGKRLLSADADGSVRLWQVEDGKHLARFAGHTGLVRAVAFFADGRRAVSAGEDRTLRVWRLPLDLPELIADLQKGSEADRLDAVAELARRGSEARPAVRALLEALKRNDKVRPRALAVLRDLLPLDREHVYRLEALLKDRGYPDGRLFALDALVKLGASARLALTGLLDALADRDKAVRRKAIASLASFATEERDRVYRPLVGALRDSDAEVQTAAESALGKLGAPPLAEVPALRRDLADKARVVRRYALNALADLGEDGAAAVPELVERITREDVAELRRLAVSALVKIAPRQKNVVSAFTRALADEDADVRLQAVRGLDRAGAVAGLLSALAHDDEEVSKAAGLALDRATFERQHVKLLAALLASKRAAVRLRGVEALAELGEDAGDGVPALAKLLTRSRGEELSKVVEALGKLGPAAKPAGPALAALLKDRDRGFRMTVCRVLAKTGAQEASKAVPILIDALKAEKLEEIDDDQAREERGRARSALVSLGKPAVKPLLQALEGEFAGGAEVNRLNVTIPGNVLKARARLEVIKALKEMGSAEAGSNDVLLALARAQQRDAVRAVREEAKAAWLRLQRKE
jgi:WD40 repeat protein/HEAT repeat protein